MEVLMKKALMIIAHEGFRDEEYTETRTILEENGIEITTASTELGTATGKFETKITVNTTLKDVDTNKYQAIIYIGGAGCTIFWDDLFAHKIAKQALIERKILAAICSAPVTLARAGLLKGIKATCFPGDAEQLKAEGALYTGNPVENTGLIITANGPDATAAFSAEIIKVIEQLN